MGLDEEGKFQQTIEVCGTLRNTADHQRQGGIMWKANLRLSLWMSVICVFLGYSTPMMLALLPYIAVQPTSTVRDAPTPEPAPEPSLSEQRVPTWPSFTIVTGPPAGGTESSATAAIINSLAALLWPVAIMLAVYMFRVDIHDLIRRLRRGKILGQEIELDERLRELEGVAETTRRANSLDINIDARKESQPSAQGDSISEILREAASSPKAAIISLAVEIESEARRILASIGHLRERRHISGRQAIAELDRQYGGLGFVLKSMELFSDVRNRIVHRGDASDDQVLQAIDSGISILWALQAIPRELNTVVEPGVIIYEDSEGTRPVEGAKGVILEKESPGGVKRQRMIFPTMRDHFRKGQRVAWEWDLTNVFGAAWYRDPETRTLEKAWESSA